MALSGSMAGLMGCGCAKQDDGFLGIVAGVVVRYCERCSSEWDCKSIAMVGLLRGRYSHESLWAQCYIPKWHGPML